MSVLVSTFRRPSYLDGLFDTLENQDLDPSLFEVVIADNASGDTTWDVLTARVAQSPLAVRSVRVIANGGPSTGRNAAVSEARAALVVFTDDDCLAEPQWLASMLAAFDSGARVLQGRTVPDDGPRTRWDHTVGIRTATPLFETCNVGYHRDDVVAAGGFRQLDGYRPGRGGAPFGGEDTVLGWDIVRAAKTALVFVPDAVVRHRIEPRDYRGWLKMRSGTAIFPALVANVPEMRRELFLRWFLSSRSAAFDLAFVGLVAAVAARSVIPLVLLVPYLFVIAPRRGIRRGLKLLIPLVIGDAAAAWSLLRGSIRQRRVVL